MRGVDIRVLRRIACNTAVHVEAAKGVHVVVVI